MSTKQWQEQRIMLGSQPGAWERISQATATPQTSSQPQGPLLWFWATAGPNAGPAHSPQRQDAVLAEAVPTASLVGVVKHRVAEGTSVPLFQLLHKLVLCVRLKVQGDGVAGILADEGTGDSLLLLWMSHPGKTERATSSVYSDNPHNSSHMSGSQLESRHSLQLPATWGGGRPARVQTGFWQDSGRPLLLLDLGSP